MMKIDKTQISKVIKNKLFVPVAFVALAASAVTGVVGIAHADTSATASTQSSATAGRVHGTPPAAVGTVTAVTGDMITLTDAKNSTTYTIDAANATITKHTVSVGTSVTPTLGTRPVPTKITVSQVAVGDTLIVQGTANGTTITATKIQDGVGMKMGGFGGGRGFGGGVMGTVTAVSGNTVSVTGKDGKSYNVDAANSTVGKFETIPVSSIQVGDSVGIQGTVSGTSVTAKSIMDGLPTSSKL
jgi:hypothetical protein